MHYLLRRSFNSISLPRTGWRNLVRAASWSLWWTQASAPTAWRSSRTPTSWSRTLEPVSSSSSLPAERCKWLDASRHPRVTSVWRPLPPTGSWRLSGPVPLSHHPLTWSPLMARYSQVLGVGCLLACWFAVWTQIKVELFYLFTFFRFPRPRGLTFMWWGCYGLWLT